MSPMRTHAAPTPLGSDEPVIARRYVAIASAERPISASTSARRTSAGTDDGSSADRLAPAPVAASIGSRS